MLKLVLLNIGLIVIISAVLFVLNKLIKSEKGRDICLLISSVLTILCHYSSLLYHYLSNGTQMDFLRSNPNLILPIYPCNVVMWCCLIYGLLKNKKSKFADYLVDYIFWFGIVSCLVGMFANVDFVRNPTLADYDVTKGIVAHGFMLLNVLLFVVFKRVKIDLLQNIKHIVISILMMLVIGLYCNLLYTVVVSEETAYNVNSMFLIHSPFDGLPFLKYPLISVAAILLYFAVFVIIDLIKYKKGNRWFNRIKRSTDSE